MIFYARLKRYSVIDRQWRAFHRVGGEIGDVHFRLEGLNFETEQLTADQAARLKDHPQVELVAMTNAPLALTESMPSTFAGTQTSGVAAPAAETSIAPETAAPPSQPTPTTALGAPIARRRGRPSNAELAARKAAQEARENGSAEQ
jgi:hypothetical protein